MSNEVTCTQDAGEDRARAQKIEGHEHDRRTFMGVVVGVFVGAG